MPRWAASDLGLHYLLMQHKKNDILKWVKDGWFGPLCTWVSMYFKPDLEIINVFMLYSTEHEIYQPPNANNKHLLAEQMQHLTVLNHENSLFYGNLDFKSSLNVVLSWKAHEQTYNNIGAWSGFICICTVEKYAIGHCLNWFNRHVWLKCWYCYALKAWKNNEGNFLCLV